MRSEIVLESLRQHAIDRPAAPAFIADGKATSYAEFAEYSDGVRRAVAGACLSPDSPVGIVVPKSPPAVATAVGAALAGHAPFLPSTSLGPDALRRALDVAGAGGLVRAAGSAVERREAARGRADAAVVFTTSGSTGTPKVVPLPAAGVESFLRWSSTAFEIGPGSVVLSLAPLSFDLSLLDVWATLRSGGTVVLPDTEQSTDGGYLADLIHTTRPEVVQSVPFFLRLIGAGLDLRRLPPGFDSVRHLILTGDKLPGELLSRIPGLFPRAAVYNVYGCTETNDSFLHRITDFDLPPGAEVPIGAPIPGVTARITGADGRELVGAATGELSVHTPFQTSGYSDPAAGADRFELVDGPAGPIRFYRTGDVVHRDANGLVYLRGRSDWVVKVRGVRTDLQEIEAVLQSHPLIDEVAVLADHDEVEGHRLRAEIRVFGGSRINSLQARTHCANALPVTAVPSTFTISDTPLPRTSTGKIDRRRLVRNHR
ncbi:AMP-binding protein [Nocardia sp. NPDC057227]|uniref:AMP-binding protein n=1 Tax=Nocardia sp. NPDC057227 TaxID=3346056 RepID=UPI003627FF82